MALTILAYLFYDMNPKTYCSPIVYETKRFEYRAGTAESENKESFSISYSDVLDGIPLSLYVHRILTVGASTREHTNFEDAYNYLERQLPHKNNDLCLGGRVAIVSLGRSISIGTNNDGGLVVNV